MFRALLTGPAHGLVGKIRVHMYQQQIDSSGHSDLHHRLPAAVRLDQTSRFSARWMQVMGSLGRSPLESGSRAQASPAHTERRALSRDSAPYWETVRKTGSRSFQPLLVTPTPLKIIPNLSRGTCGLAAGYRPPHLRRQCTLLYFTYSVLCWQEFLISMSLIVWNEHGS